MPNLPRLHALHDKTLVSSFELVGILVFFFFLVSLNNALCLIKFAFDLNFVPLTVKSAIFSPLRAFLLDRKSVV